MDDDDDVVEDEVEDDNVKGEEDDDVEDHDVEEEDRSQDRDTHFGRACAIEMHVEISQEPLYTNFLLFSCVSVDLSEINCPMHSRIIPERKQKSPFLVSSPWQPEQSMYLNKACLSIIISIN